MSGPEVYAFVSVKGGVGKTTLAAAAAAGFAAEGRRVAVVDLDFVGTSVADAFWLCAPDLWDGAALRRTGPAAALLTRQETLLRRRDLWDDRAPPRVLFLNDLLFRRPARFDPELIAWRDAESPIRWFPTSPGLPQAREAAHHIWVGRESTFTRKLSRVLGALFQYMHDGVVILDLPPGLYGVVNIVDGVVRASLPDLTGYAYALVSSEDRNDLYRSVDDFRYLWLDLDVPARWILNRHLRDPASARTEVRRFLGDLWRAGRIEDHLIGMPYDPEGLGSLVRSETFRVGQEVGARLVRILREGK